MMTRGESIRSFCRDCMSDGVARDCDITSCPLYRYRTKPEDATAPGKRLIRSRAIRVKCIECMGGHTPLVPQCPAVGCQLHPYRMGHRDENAPKAAECASVARQTPDTGESDPMPAGTEDAPETRRSGEVRS